MAKNKVVEDFREKVDNIINAINAGRTEILGKRNEAVKDLTKKILLEKERIIMFTKDLAEQLKEAVAREPNFEKELNEILKDYYQRKGRAHDEYSLWFYNSDKVKTAYDEWMKGQGQADPSEQDPKAFDIPGKENKASEQYQAPEQNPDRLEDDADQGKGLPQEQVLPVAALPPIPAAASGQGGGSGSQQYVDPSAQEGQGDASQVGSSQQEQSAPVVSDQQYVDPSQADPEQADQGGGDNGQVDGQQGLLGDQEE